MIVPYVGVPLFEIPLAGQAPTVPGRLVERLPLMAVLVPPKVMPPFEPTSPPKLTWLLGGFAGVVSVEELKLPVFALPARLRGTGGPHPAPVANMPAGSVPVGGSAISCWTTRLAPFGITAIAVTRYTGVATGFRAAHWVATGRAPPPVTTSEVPFQQTGKVWVPLPSTA